MLKIALTGGIGSGKSTVAELFHELGVPIIDADIAARRVVEPGRPALSRIVEQFGDDILQPDGGLDRARLRQLIFQSPEKREQLETILHPLIRAEMERRSNELHSRYCIFVIPLLIETGQQQRYDRVLVVDADEELRSRRVQARDSVNKEDVAAIMQNQSKRSKRLAAADDIITNNGDQAELKAQVLDYHRRYNSMTTEEK